MATGVKRSLEEVHETESQSDTSSIPPSKKIQLENKSEREKVAWTSSQLFKVNPGECEWWKSTVVYEVYVRSFHDSNGDGIGDLKGIQQKLDYFVDIGVETLWLSPVYASPMKDFGYDISDFTDIDPIFGTLDDFKELMAAMKEKNLKLVMDFVPNHTSDQHEWFIKSCQKVEPYTYYYIWLPSKGLDEYGKQIPPNNWVSVFGGSMWEWSPVRKEFYLHQFTKEQPDLDFRNPLVVKEIKDVIRFWLDLGVDGFRMDAVAHIFEDPEFQDEPPSATASKDLGVEEYAFWDHPHTSNLPEILDFLRDIRCVLDEFTKKDGHPRLMMTEAYLSCDDLLKYYGTKEAPIASFPFNFDFISNLKKGFTASDIFKIVTSWVKNAEDGNWPNWVLGNHDVPRVRTRLGREMVDIMNVITQLLPGTSVTYYGEEIGMEDLVLSWAQTVDPAGRNAGVEKFEQYSRDPERTPMQWNAEKNAGFTTADTPWLPVNPNFTTINVKKNLDAKESHMKVFQKLTLARKTKTFIAGHLEIKVSEGSNVLAFSRIVKDKDTDPGFLVVINLGSSTAEVDATSFLHVPENLSVYIQTSSSTKNESTPSDVISSAILLNPKSAVVYKFIPDWIQ